MTRFDPQVQLKFAANSVAALVIPLEAVHVAQVQEAGQIPERWLYSAFSFASYRQQVWQMPNAWHASLTMADRSVTATVPSPPVGMELPLFCKLLSTDFGLQALVDVIF